MSGIKKYGTFAGVFTPSLLTILGVIMYMRMGAVVGNSSTIWMAIGIILLAHLISVTTGLSVSSIATDKKIKAGGIYYMLSRSLGLPIGGAIGVTIFVATALSISLYLIGFAESVMSVLPFEKISINHLRVGGSLALACVVAIALISTSLAMKAQYVILGIIALSLVSIGLGDAEGLKPGPEHMDSPSFGLLFGIFFPAVTGFTAGVAMSGDLKNPLKSIPWGTMLAIGVGLIVYLFLALFLYFSIDSEILSSNYNVIVEFAWYGSFFVVAGIWGATLSSALGGILGAPRILQAMSNDTIAPQLFGKGVGVNNEPRNALILTALIAFCGILIGDLNAIAEIVAMFYMTAYFFINVSCWLESFTPDFKPKFKISRFIPLLGAAATAVLMIQLNALAAIIAIIVVIGIFLYYKKKQVDSGSGDVWNSVWFSVVKTGLKNLQKKSTHKRNWEPNMLLFSGGSNRRKELISFSKSLAGTNGMISNFDLIENATANVLFPKHQQSKMADDDSDNTIFYRQQECQNVYRGIENIAGTYGFSGIDPNTTLMGWGRNTSNPKEFVRMTDYLTQLDMNVLFLDYDESKGFGQYSTVDIWWTDFDEYCDLSLYLSKFLSSSEDWGGLSVRVLYDNRDNSTADYVEKIIQSKCETIRIDAEVVVVNNELEQKSLYDLVKKYSIQTDLIFLELPTFENQDELAFIESTNALLHDIGTTLIFRASSHFYEDINLDPSLQKEYLEVQTLLDFEKKEVDFVAKEAKFEEVDSLLSEVGSSLYDIHYKYSEQVYQAFSEVYTSFLKVVNGIEKGDVRSSAKLKAAIEDFKTQRLTVIKISLQKSMKRLLLDCQDAVSRLPKTIDLIHDENSLMELSSDSKDVLRMKKKLKTKGGVVKFPMESCVSYHMEKQFLANFHKILHINGLSGFMVNNAIISGLEGSAVSMGAMQEKIAAVLKREQNVFQQYSKSYIQKFLDLVIADSEDVCIFDKVVDREELKNDGDIKKVLFGLGKFPESFLKNQQYLTNKLLGYFELDSMFGSVESCFKTAVNQTIDDLNAQNQSDLLMKWTSMDKSEFLKEERFIVNGVSASAILGRVSSAVGDALIGVDEEIVVISPESINNFEKEQDKVSLTVIPFKKTTSFAIEKEFLQPLDKFLNGLEMALKSQVTEVNKGLKLMHFHWMDKNSQPKEEREIKELLAARIQSYEQVLNEIKDKLNIEFAEYLVRLRKVLNIDVLLNQSDFSHSAMLKSKAVSSGASYVGRTKNSLRKIDQKLDNVLIKLRDTVSKTSFDYRTKGLLNSQSKLGDFVAGVTIDGEVASNVPYYYQQLFVGMQQAPKKQIEQRFSELDLARNAVLRWQSGSSGMVLFTGEILSGKSYVKQNFINAYTHQKVIKVENIHNGLREGFEVNLQKVTGNYSSAESILSEFEEGTVVDICDLEYYWSGVNAFEDLEFILNLIKKHYHRLLFIVDANIHFYNHAKSLFKIDDFILTTVLIRPLSTSALKEIVLERHRAGGMKYFWNNNHEDDTRLRVENRIFTKINHHCQGNVGSVLRFWLGNIQSVEGNVLVLGRMDDMSFDFFLKPEWELVLYQVLLRKSMATDDILEIFNDGIINIEVELDNLIRSKILIKTLSNELEINPYALIFVTSYLRKHQIIL